jgi:hypothetical protein
VEREKREEGAKRERDREKERERKTHKDKERESDEGERQRNVLPRRATRVVDDGSECQQKPVRGTLVPQGSLL